MNNTSNITQNTLGQPKLSIIVPVYNVAPYLRKCVDSLLAQDYNDYEIILVDDGSTDDSWQIIQENVSRFRGGEDERIRGIHQENGGLSVARNTGIKAAKGEYIWFVDSDDYWAPNVLGSLMEQVERDNLDVLRFDYQNVRKKEDGNYEVFQPYKTPHDIDKKRNVVDGVTYLNERMGYRCYAWQFILRRDLIYSNQTSVIKIQNLDNCTLENNGLFTHDIHFEDVDWLPRMMLKAKRVSCTSTIVYNYLWREGSITLTQGNIDKIRKNIDDRLLIIDKYRQNREQYPKCQWIYNMQSSMACGILTQVAMYFYAERKTYIQRLYESNVFPLVIADQGKTYTHRAKLINLFGPTIYCAIMNFRKRIL